MLEISIAMNKTNPRFIQPLKARLLKLVPFDGQYVPF